jgi:hypothetical protein
MSRPGAIHAQETAAAAFSRGSSRLRGGPGHGLAAIRYGHPRAGALEAEIPKGCWVVVNPNMVFLRPQGS